jgi:hypothetical protein
VGADVAAAAGHQDGLAASGHDAAVRFLKNRFLLTKLVDSYLYYYRNQG